MYRKLFNYFFIISVLYSSHANSQVPLSERQVLISLYNQMSGVNWANKSGWLGKAGTECQWFGITCLNNTHITKLVLPNNRLSGKIPNKVSLLLSHLEELNLSDNRISGTLKGLESLVQLKALRLADNELSGSIPPELHLLTKLEILDLSVNNFSGAIPKEIGLLTRLKELDLSENLLYGNIPKNLGNLRNLKELRLSNNQLTGTLPPEIKSLTKLNTFSFFDNCLTLISHDFRYILPIASSIVNLDIGDHNMCNGNQHHNLPIAIMSDDYSIQIPSITVRGKSYEVYLARYDNPLDKNGWYWNVEEMDSFNVSEQKPIKPFVHYDENTSTVIFSKVRVSQQIIKATLKIYHNPSDINGVYFKYKQ